MKYLQKLSTAASSPLGATIRIIAVFSGLIINANFQNQFVHIIVNMSLIVIMIISFAIPYVTEPTGQHNSIDGLNAIRSSGIIILLFLAAAIMANPVKAHDKYTGTICAITFCAMAANIVLDIMHPTQSENNEKATSHQKVPETQSELIRLHHRFNVKYNPSAKSTHLPLPSKIGSNALIITRVNTTPIYPGAMDPIYPEYLLPQLPYRTIAVLDDRVISVKTANPIEKDSPVAWQQAHDASLSQTIEVIVNAIHHNKKKINIVYEYDGIEAYATGRWPVADNKAAQEYVNELTSLANQTEISFTKLTDNIFNYYQPLIKLANLN